jgi:hypothetical protein
MTEKKRVKKSFQVDREASTNRGSGRGHRKNGKAAAS